MSNLVKSDSEMSQLLQAAKENGVKEVIVRVPTGTRTIVNYSSFNLFGYELYSSTTYGSEYKEISLKLK